MPHYAVRLSAAVVTFLFGIATAYVPNILTTSHSGTAPDAEAVREVLSVEREYIRAHLERDVAALDDILTDDFVIGPAMGRVFGQETRLALVANPSVRFLSINTEDVRVSVNGDEAEVTGRARVHGLRRGREFTTPAYSFTRSYQRRDGRWQIRYVIVAYEHR